MAVLSIAVLLAFTDRLIINLVVEDLRVELRLSDLELSVIQGVGFAFIYAVGGLAMGRLADRFSRRNLIAGGVLIWSLATMACAFADTFGQLLVPRMLVGLGEAILLPAAASMISDSFPERVRGRALGSFAIGAVLGSGIALTLGASMLASIQSGTLDAVAWTKNHAAWRSLLLVAGLPGIALLPLFLMLREPVRRSREGVQSLRSVIAHLAADQWRVARICLSIGVVAAGDYGLLSWLPTMLQRDYSFSAVRIGTIVGTVVAVAGLLACVASGYLSDAVAAKSGAAARSRVMVSSYALCALGAILFFVPGLVCLGIGFVLWIAGSVAGSVVGSTVLQESVPYEMRATTSAFSGLSSAMIGLGVGPTMVIILAKYLFLANDALRPSIAVVCSGAALVALVLLLRPAAVPTVPEH